MPSTYTSPERRKRAGLLAGGARYALAGASTARHDRQLDRIAARAEDRWAREAAAALRLVEQARNALATAKAVLRAAPRKERPAARAAVKRAEQRARDTERSAKKYQ